MKDIESHGETETETIDEVEELLGVKGDIEVVDIIKDDGLVGNEELEEVEDAEFATEGCVSDGDVILDESSEPGRRLDVLKAVVGEVLELITL